MSRHPPRLGIAPALCALALAGCECAAMPAPAAPCATSDDCPAAMHCDQVRGFCFAIDAAAHVDAATAADATPVDAAARDTIASDAGGDAATADAATGDAATADAATGDAATRDAATGDAATGDAATGDAAPQDAGPVSQLEQHQGRYVTMAAAETEVLAEMTPAVVAARSILFFGATSLSNNPTDGHVAGQLLDDGSAVRFTRNGSGVEVDIRFWVVQLRDVRVQRGTALFPAWTTTLDIPLANAVDTYRSFSLPSLRIVGGNYNSNDWCRFSLDSVSGITAHRYDGESDMTIEWQLVEIVDPAAVVRSFAYTLAAGTVSQNTGFGVNYPREQSMALISYAVLEWTSNQLAPHLLRVEVIQPGQVQIYRGVGGLTADVSYQVVIWPALDVQHNVTTLAVGQISATVEHGMPVDPDRSVVLAPAIQRQGSTSYVENADDHIGIAWFTFDLTPDGRAVVVRRAFAAGDATVNWSVVQFD